MLIMIKVCSYFMFTMWESHEEARIYSLPHTRHNPSWNRIARSEVSTDSISIADNFLVEVSKELCANRPVTNSFDRCRDTMSKIKEIAHSFLERDNKFQLIYSHLRLIHNYTVNISHVELFDASMYPALPYEKHCDEYYCHTFEINNTTDHYRLILRIIPESNVSSSTSKELTENTDCVSKVLWWTVIFIIVCIYWWMNLKNYTQREINHLVPRLEALAPGEQVNNVNNHVNVILPCRNLRTATYRVI